MSALLRLVLGLTLLMWCVLASPASPASSTQDDPSQPGFSIVLPADAGAHPGARTEWWYVTGWLLDQGKPIGFQVTFFRSSLPYDPNNPSAFSTHDAIFAHAALSDPRETHILTDQRSMRAAFGLAAAAQSAMEIHLNDWSLRQDGAGPIHASIDAAEFKLALSMNQTEPVLLEGPAGVSHKGAAADAVSAYYSLPQLNVTGTVSLHGKNHAVTGHAWLDHEWSNNYLEPDAQGWDWLGADFDDGGALMAFRMRDSQGGVLWSAATRRTADGQAHYFNQNQVSFSPVAQWRSPRSKVSYPVSMQVRVGSESFILKPLLEDQEFDARASTGTLYWEGAVTIDGGSASPAGALGQGYLELTGYGSKLRLQ